MKITGQKLFKKGDGSEIQRLNWIYNKSKHIGFDKLSENDLHPIWLSNEGIVCNECKLTWKELENILEDVGDLANSLSNGKLSNEA